MPKPQVTVALLSRCTCFCARELAAPLAPVLACSCAQSQGAGWGKTRFLGFLWGKTRAQAQPGLEDGVRVQTASSPRGRACWKALGSGEHGPWLGGAQSPTCVRGLPWAASWPC